MNCTSPINLYSEILICCKILSLQWYTIGIAFIQALPHLRNLDLYTSQKNDFL